MEEPLNKPTTAYRASLVGGAVGLLVSFTLMTAAFFLSIDQSFLFIATGTWCLFCSTAVIACAGELREKPKEHIKWGASILVFSIAGLGSIISVVGGVLGLTFNPYPPRQTSQLQPQSAQLQTTYLQPPESQQSFHVQPYPQPIFFARYCPQCGRGVAENANFCQYCGRQLNPTLSKT